MTYTKLISRESKWQKYNFLTLKNHSVHKSQFSIH